MTPLCWISLILSLTASGDHAAPQNRDRVVTIGVIASVSGDLKPWGEDSWRGAQLALNEFNRHGGLGKGRSVRLVMADAGSKPEQGREAALTLVHQGVIGLIGEVASGITNQIAAAAKETRTPVIAPDSTRPGLTQDKNWLFRVCYEDSVQGPAMARFAYEDLHLRLVGLMTDKMQPYSIVLSDGFREEFTRLGGKVSSEEFYESGQTQFTEQLAKLKAAKPQALYLSGYFNEAGPIMRQSRDLGLGVQFLGGDGWDSSQILSSSEGAVNGAYITNLFNNGQPGAKVKHFLAIWNKKYRSVPATTCGPLTYDATMLMLDALRRSNGKSRDGLRKAIDATVDFPGVTGTITLKGMHGSPAKGGVIVKMTPEGPTFVKSFGK